MSRRISTHRILLVAALIASVGYFFWLTRRLSPEEQALTAWLEKLFYWDGSTYRSQKVFVPAEVRAMGTNVFPFLYRMIETQDYPLTRMIVHFRKKTFDDKFLVESGFLAPFIERRRAIVAFETLGRQAAPAIPELLKLDATQFAIHEIARQSIDASPIPTGCLTNQNRTVRVHALIALSVLLEEGNFREETSLIPLLIGNISEPDPYIRRFAISAVSNFRKRAKAAVPLLLTCATRDSDPIVRSVALDALKLIDADAARTIGTGKLSP